MSNATDAADPGHRTQRTSLLASISNVVIDPYSGIRVLGDSLPYLDGAEEELTSIFAGAADRSSTSDELVTHVRDWPTRYHLTRQRSNLVRPLRIEPSMRVLEIGCGTGAITRWLGEQGAAVVGLEGNLMRARAAAARCADLGNVEIVAGDLAALIGDITFDVVVVVGVLEYSAASAGGGRGPAAFLEQVRDLVEVDGTVVLAIENQFGLKYLLGYAEDHLALPWVGVEGYLEPKGVRTWSRRRLGHMLADAGFGNQRWLFPFPDYKMPTLVLDESIYELPDAPSVVDNFVRQPVRDLANPRALLCDDRQAHRELLDAGLGPDVANSFLVIASGSEEPAHTLVDDNLGWLFGDERLSMWRRERVLERNADNEVTLVDRSPAGPERSRAWLGQQLDPPTVVARGAGLDTAILRACAHHDIAELERLLRLWSSELLDASTTVDPPLAADRHPFLLAGTTRLLPGDFLDASISNFILQDDGSLRHIDREWVAIDGVGLDLVLTRSLRYLAEWIITLGSPHPWSSSLSVDDLTLVLAPLAGADVSPADLARLAVSEGELQHLVNDAEPTSVASHFADVGRRRRSDLGPVQLPFVSLDREAKRARAETEQLRAELVELQRVHGLTQDHVANLEDVRSALEEQVATLVDDAAERSGEIDRLSNTVEDLRHRLDSLEASKSVRIAKAIRRR